jgi:carbon-monoxide dehydrogenase medium subunit
VKPAPFDYVRATSLEEALALVARHGAGCRVIAGGQSLVAALNMRLESPALLVDIGRVPGLSDIARMDDGGLAIGALTRHAEIEHSPLVRERAPLLSEAAPHIAHVAIRNRGTLGGSLALADPAAEWPACLVALDGTIVARNAGRERKIAARDFFQGLYDTALEPDELIIQCEIPSRGRDARSGFAEIARRRGDYAMAGLASDGVFRDGQFAGLRLVYFAVQTTPVLAKRAAESLMGGSFDETRLKNAQAALAQDLTPTGDLNAAPATKLHFARVLLARVATAMAQGQAS